MDPLKHLQTFEPAKKAVSFVEEFRSFAFKGNVIDLAVGVIIGAAFGKIVDSLVKNIIMPLISLVLPSEESYKDWALQIGKKKVLYGEFLGDLLNFVVVALVLFVFTVKFLGWLRKLRDDQLAALVQPAPAAVPLTRDQELLVEIRDLLKKKSEAAP